MCILNMLYITNTDSCVVKCTAWCNIDRQIGFYIGFYIDPICIFCFKKKKLSLALALKSRDIDQAL